MKPELPKETKNPVIDFLKSRNLLILIYNQIGLKVVNEKDSIIALFILSCGRLVKNANLASFNAIVNDGSGVGKDHVATAVLGVWSKLVMLQQTRISPQAFTYWKQPSKREKELGLPPWSWDGKIVYLEDIDNKILNSPTFKVMCSSGSHAVVVKDQKAEEIKIHGKPVIIVTIANPHLSAELLRRFVIINLDSSEEQTKAIMEHHARQATSGLKAAYDENLTGILSYLERYSVKIPYAQALTEFMPDGILMRTHFRRVLDIIKASCCLHQYQREKDLDGFLIAEKQDYEIAMQVINKLTTNSHMVSISKDQQKILEIFEGLGDLWFSVSELLSKVDFIQTEKWLKKQLDSLVASKLLERDIQERADSIRKLAVYRKSKTLTLSFPSWEELSKKCTNKTNSTNNTNKTISTNSE